LPLDAYADLCRPFGLDGTFLEGGEPVIGRPEGVSFPAYSVPREYCSKCTRFVECGEGSGEPRYTCSLGLFQNDDGSLVHFCEAEAACVQTRCTEFQPKSLAIVSPCDLSSLHPLVGFPGVFAASTALIDARAVIGAGTKIWHYSVVGAGAVIGRNCVVGSHVTIDGGTLMGSGCHIQNGARLFKGVVLGDNVFVGPQVVFTNDRYPRVSPGGFSLEKTRVGRNASIGAGAVVRCGITIGPFAMVGAGSVVTKDVPEDAVVVGVPAERLLSDSVA